MSIDWATVNRVRNVNSSGEPRIVYLVKGSLYYDGAETAVYWCGPADRIRSGLQRNEPGTSTLRQWEARAIGLKTSEEMAGPLHDGMVAGSLELDIACGGENSDDLYTMAGPGGGRWASWPVTVWAYDTETDGYEEVFSGHWGRDPDNISRDSFSVSARESVGSFGEPSPWTVLDPSGWTKSTDWNSTPTWTDSNADGEWYPPGAWDAVATGYGMDIHPDLLGFRVGPVFGEGAAGWPNHTLGSGVTGSEMNGVWREAVIYGASPDYYYLHVSPIGNATDGGCFVWDLVARVTPFSGETVYQVTEYVASRHSGVGNDPELATFINTDPTAGPTGTNLRWRLPSLAQLPNSELNWRDPDGSERMRVFVLVSGHYKADVGGTDWNASTNPFLNTDGGNGYDPRDAAFGPESPQTPRWDYDEILEDLLTDTDFIQSAETLGTGAMSAFTSDAPVSSNAFNRRVCALSPLPSEDAPTVSAVVGDLLKSLNAALIRKWDSTANVRAWYPVWRRPFSTDSASDATPIRAGWLVSQDPPSFRAISDPRREYANRINLKGPVTMSSPHNADSAQENTYMRRAVGSESNSSEKTASNGTVIESNRELKHFRHFDPTPQAGAASDGLFDWRDANLSEAAQRQTYVDAELGPRAIGLYLGDLIRYVDIDRMPTAIGQVRGREIDWDSLTVLLTSWHGTITYS